MPAPTLSDDLHAELIATTKQLHRTTAGLVAAGELSAESLTDEQGDNWMALLAGETDASAIVYLLTLHKLAERQADNFVTSPLRLILEAEAATFFHILHRLAPDTFADALALWCEQTEGGEGTPVLTFPLDVFKEGDDDA